MANNTITLSSFGTFCKNFPNPENKLTIDNTCLIANDVSETLANEYKAHAEKMYCAISTMMTVRETETKEGNFDLIRDAEKAVLELSNTWFKFIGTRPAKKDSEEIRPAYGTRYSDYALYGEMVQQALTLAKGSVTKAQTHFFKLLVLASARIINGESLQRITKAELDIQKAELVKARADKAKATKEENEKAKSEEEADIAEKESKLEELNLKLEQNLSNIEKAITLVMNSHATEEEKINIVAMLKVENL